MRGVRAVRVYLVMMIGAGSGSVCLPSVLRVGLSEGTGDDRGHERELERGGRRGEDLGELTRVVELSVAAKQLQIPPLGRKSSASPDGSDRQRWKGDSDRQTCTVIGRLAECDGVFGDAGGVLAGGQIKRGQCVGEMKVVSEHANRLCGRYSQLLEIEDRPRSHSQ